MFFRKIFFIFLCFLFFPTFSFSSSKLVVEENSFDFGKVMEGEELVHTFILKNEGDSPLKIRGIRKSCGCITSSIEGKEISPSSSISMKVLFKTKGFRDKEDKIVRVFTNDPESSSFSFHIKAEIIPSVKVAPPSIFFMEVFKGEESKPKRVNIEVFQKGVEIEKVYTRSKYILLKKEEKNSFSVRISKDAPRGVLRDKIIIKTSREKDSLIIVPVFASVKGAYYFEPSDISFGLIQSPMENERRKEIIVKSRDAKDVIKVIETRSNSSYLDINIIDEGGSEGSFPILNITLNKNALGTIREKVEVDISNREGERKTISFTVYAIVEKKGD